MTHNNDPLITESTVPVVSQRRKGNSLRFWLLLGGSSILFHGGILHWFGRFTPSVSAGASLEAFMPIEWVALPPDAALPQEASTLYPTESTPAQSQALAEAAASTSSKVLNPNVPESHILVWTAQTSLDAPQFDDPLTTLPPTEPAVPSATPAAQSAEELATSPTSLNSPNTTPVSSAPASLTPTSSQSSTQPRSEAALEVDSDRQSLESQLETQPETQPVKVAIRPIDRSGPQSLPLDLQQIDVPIPDVSGTLPTESNPDIDVARVTAEIVVPSQLIASLTTIEPLPPEQTDLQVDESAYPKTEQHTFSSSPGSPCVVMPEAVPFLGQVVSMQVTTDELGQVVNTVTHESSQNQAYDELATCLIRNWEFSPALAQGQPIETNSLIVRITIEAEG